ncbi:hypothetical protein CHGG_07194 [Chaetomium globosum CBS 148.51]|uniref:Transthyretin/hydroxyisourate hydrolase domain-containing protein n=1 Tax=Chaetomium globosum (strain ATCC 6205 / CBS 148.51 / DSM 1962 / NBRC 6347 / NRRL 1970) TaxID=306901 RepID=Q2GXW0_CHAGB|nr:uncharacterized protein CHGG_07194 [Chaetomium globosum CBS 148.51]EAQ85941.1 hypothetical protein CHGG_07194 [Chaetomium globosum CBS 148.51]
MATDTTETKDRITCHVLDTTTGQPARNMRVKLELTSTPNPPHATATTTPTTTTTTTPPPPPRLRIPYRRRRPHQILAALLLSHLLGRGTGMHAGGRAGRDLGAQPMDAAV